MLNKLKTRRQSSQFRRAIKDNVEGKKVKSYEDKLIDYGIFLEYKSLKDTFIPGLYVMPSLNDIRWWYGVLFIKSRRYESGIFRFILDLRHYKKQTPKVYFQSFVFNPLVRPHNGELDLSIQFPKWDTERHLISHVLAYIREIFYVEEFWEPRAQHEPFNIEASRLWREKSKDFDEACRDCVELSAKSLKDSVDMECPIKFGPHQDNHASVRDRIIRSDNERQNENFSYADWFSDGWYNIKAFDPRRKSNKVDKVETIHSDNTKENKNNEDN